MQWIDHRSKCRIAKLLAHAMDMSNSKLTDLLSIVFNQAAVWPQSALVTSIQWTRRDCHCALVGSIIDKIMINQMMWDMSSS